jgi:flotillin
MVTLTLLANMSFFTSTTFIVIAVAVVVIAGLIIASYVKAPPDVAYIISGLRKKPKVLIGKAGLRIPFLERKDTLIVKQISIDVKTSGYIPTQDFIGVDIDAVCKVRMITGDQEVEIGEAPNKRKVKGIELAMRNFLNMSEDQIERALVDSLQGNMREIIGTQELRTLCNDRKAFGDEVQKKAQTDMNALGVEIISCNIQKITDEKNLIPQLGQDNMSKIQKDASIAKAVAEKDVAVAEAKAKQEANEAEVNSETDIAEKQNALALKKAELKAKADTEQAKADAAYKIQEQEQQKAINIKTVEAETEKTKKEQELTSEQVKIQENKLNAEIRKQAEADKYKVEQAAAADLEKIKRESEARKYQAEQDALAKVALAKAEKDAMLLHAEGIKAEGEAEAYKIQKAGEAEAVAIEKKGLAEAEAMHKKAEAYERYGQAAILDMMIQIMPEVAKSVAEPISAIKNMNVYGSGAEAAGISGNVPTVIAQAFDVLKSATGVDMTDVVRSHTIDAKVNRNIKVDANATVDTEAPEVVEPTEGSEAPGGDQE